MTDDNAGRMALEHAALVTAVRRYVTEHGHALGSCRWQRCVLCEALAVVDRPKTEPAVQGGSIRTHRDPYASRPEP